MAAVVLLEIILRRKMGSRRKRLALDTTIVAKKTRSDHVGPDTKCRVCLNEGSIPIFQQDDVANNIMKFGCIELNEGDGFPKSLCNECHGLLQSAVFFHKLAQESDRILRTQGHAIKPEINSSDDGRDNHDTDTKWKEVDEKREDSHLHRCRKCDITFNTAEEHLEHRKSESHRKPRVQCPQCNVTVCKGSLKAHITRLHTAPAAHPYICDVCGKSFPMKGSLKRHLMIHTDELPFRCQHCPYRCRYRASLTEHTRVHTGEKPYACAHCPASFPNASNFRKHARTHQTDKQFQCEHCERGFHTSYKMKAHIKVDHMGRKDYVCALCGKEFGYKEKLGQHMKNVHKSPKKRSGRLPLYLEIDARLNRRGNLHTMEDNPP